MHMNKNEFIEETKKLGIIISDEQLGKLQLFYSLLFEANKIMNLTNIIKEEDVYLKHFYDSLTIVKVCDLTTIDSLCDVGTGAGFPGLVLKIIFPNISMVLIDSTEKKVCFIKEIIEKLGLEGINAIHDRVEEYAINHHDCFDIVTSRAVANLSILTELCLPLVKVNGYFIAMKGNATDELSKISNNLIKLNSRVEKCEVFLLPKEESNRTLIKIIKEKTIDKKYPREFREIKKKPL